MDGIRETKTERERETAGRSVFFSSQRNRSFSVTEYGNGLFFIQIKGLPYAFMLKQFLKKLKRQGRKGTAFVFGKMKRTKEKEKGKEQTKEAVFQEKPPFPTKKTVAEIG
jgi:hypothetical protein